MYRQTVSIRCLPIAFYATSDGVVGADSSACGSITLSSKPALANFDGRTCKQLGAKKKFNENVWTDTYLQEFQRIYNRMYSRYYRMDVWDSDRQTNKLTET